MSIPDWLPGVERVAGSDAGPMWPGSSWKLLLHTTEGPTLDGAIAALRAKSAWSHFIFDPDTGRLVQAVAMNRAAKALRSGGNLGRTNAARVIQVEIVGRAADTPSWSAARNVAVGRMIARIATVVPFRLEMPLGFYGPGAGWVVASARARQRMPWTDWYRFDAICGHQHAPANDHWDPGAINAAQILTAARAFASGTQPTTTDEEQELMAARDEINEYTRLQTDRTIGTLQTNLKDLLGVEAGGKSVTRVVQDAANGEIAFLTAVIHADAADVKKLIDQRIGALTRLAGGDATAAKAG